MDARRFEQQLQFILELDKEKQILRQTHLSGHGRRENDAEHAWHLGIMAWLLQEYANTEIDVAKVMLMVLLHDVVEIDAGDTYAYDDAAKQTEAVRERAAADRLYGLLPPDQGERLKALWQEFDAYETPEARYAHMLDNFQPMLLNDANGGSDWQAHGVNRAQVERRNAKTGTGSADIWAFMQTILDRHEAKGTLQ